jgi:hypothetical protein
MKEELNTKIIGPLPKVIQEIRMLWTTGLSKQYLKSLSDLHLGISSKFRLRRKMPLATKNIC